MERWQKMANDLSKNFIDLGQVLSKALLKNNNKAIGGFYNTPYVPEIGEQIISLKEAKQMVKSSMDQAAKNNEHLDHPFYKKVDDVTEEVALEQILKGAAKYDEPFNPGSWSGRQLTIHALQELRDGQVYVVGMMEKFEEMESEIRKLTEIIDLHEKDKRDLLDAITNRDREIERLKGDKNIYYGKWKELEEKTKSFTTTITVNLNGNVDSDFDGAKVAEQLAEQLKKGLSNL